jgi:hypothetical protein
VRGGRFSESRGGIFHPRKVLQSPDNVLICFKAKSYSFAVMPLELFSCLQPSKLNTRVRFPSPAPIVSVTYTASDTYFRQNRLNTSDKVFLVCSQRSCRTAFLNLDEYPNSGPQIAFRDTLQLCLVLHSTRTSLSSASFSFLWSSFLNRSSTNAVSRLVTRRMPRRLPS